MAVTSGTNYKKQEQIARQNGGQAYTGLRGVSPNTAQKLGNYQTGYQPGQQAQAAQQTLQQVQAQKPQSYNSKYGAQLDSIMQQIANPKQFKYEFNGDEMFKYYADLYTQKGRQASMDAMGQAAALTGGYGNSYAQQVGQQGYEQYLLGLYDKGMDLQNAAYARYQDAQNQPYRQLEALQARDESEYGRYRDTVGDWERELGRAEDAARYEREFDYNDWAAQQDYYTKLAQIENADYQTEADRQEAIRQFQMNYDRNVLESDRAYNRGVLESDRAYNRDVLESDRAYQEAIRQANLDEAYRQKTFNRDVLESDRAYNRDVLESDRAYQEAVRQANLDEAYRQKAFNRSAYENDRDYNRDVLENDRAFNEAVRQANLDEAYRNKTFSRDVLENDRAFNEQVRQANLDNKYRKEAFEWEKGQDVRNYYRDVLESDRAFNEAVRQANIDNQYRTDYFNWQQGTDQRDFDETKRLNDQKVAANYAMAILENGQMPSLEMLTAAGLSEEDAQKLMAEAQQIMVYGGGAPATAEETPKSGVNVVTRTPTTSSTASGGVVNITPTAPTTTKTTTPVVSTPVKTATFADLTKQVQQKLQDALNKALKGNKG